MPLLRTLISRRTPDDVDIHDAAFVRDPFAAYERLRRDGPLARSNKHGGFWLMSRYEDVRAAAAGVARMEMVVALETLVETGVSLSLDPAAAPQWKTRGDRRRLSSLPLIIKKKKAD